MGIPVRLKGKTEAELIAENPVLLDRQICFATDAFNFKVGPGAWNSLTYWLTAGSPVFLGRFYEVDIPTTGTIGQYLINRDTSTYWQWNIDNSQFEDTGDPVQDFGVDVYPTLGSNNLALSGGIAEIFDQKAATVHSHTISDVTGLNDELALKLTITDFLTQLVANTQGGPGISLSIVAGKLRITNTGDGGTGSGDFVDIGGLPLENIALAAEFAKYQKKPGGWTPVTPSSGTITLVRSDDKGQDQRFRYTESGDVTIVLSGTYVEGDIIWLETIMDSDSHTITLPSGFRVKGVTKSTVPYTEREAGETIETWFVNKGSYWEVYEEKAPEETTGTGLPAGGTTGQVLKKQSNDDGDAEWEDETGGTALPLQTDSYVFTSGAQTFTLSESPSNVVGIFLNGIRLKLTSDYTIVGTTLTIVNNTLEADDEVIAVYNYSGGGGGGGTTDYEDLTNKPTIGGVELTGNKTLTELGVTAAIQAAIDALIGAAPGALNTLDELAAALADDASFSTTVLAAIAARQAPITLTTTGSSGAASFDGTTLNIPQYTGGGGATNLDGLTDVVISSPSTNQVLKYNGTNWVNDTDATGGGGVTDGDKGDIIVSASGATWKYDSVSFVDTIIGATLNFTLSNAKLEYNGTVGNVTTNFTENFNSPSNGQTIHILHVKNTTSAVQITLGGTGVTAHKDWATGGAITFVTLPAGSLNAEHHLIGKVIGSNIYWSVS